jgi:hypothetical protein
MSIDIPMINLPPVLTNCPEVFLTVKAGDQLYNMTIGWLNRHFWQSRL